ncbi:MULTISPECIES: gp436 family protein [Pasteurellaceae]|uniref:DUF1320 domain-containing protein n=1 Tax=Pasteurella atlantica TaxID=2827233 RepID=A0AAW8CR24_9PAST|nr:DUF1320 domain-containing protein [Pasteurella atlantica]MBR0574076.1 DUF1320 domain-containing protein [Pasteurella atlantica]MDP8040101.1 DUF1320 domain-containing protein [Pasteurella atlantica]MDP8042214.1 DUF1320 domain-containing protein [Pasteurella atlantica]MDP8044379.1 DUF1320 domain-containing protein [Pasteurella atlantica]MDP8046373.1 DUF1320 domain-containing protein [Pasteurella atlantica]
MYANTDDFLKRVGEQEAIELTDREMTGEVNIEVLNTALSDSSSQVDGYLAGRYRLPLKTIPQNLVRICCDLARYRLCSMSSHLITDEVIERYKLSLKELENISKGVVSLGITNTDENTNTDNGEFSVQFFNGNNRIFKRDR